MKVVREEVSTLSFRRLMIQIFGPVIVASKFKDEAEAIELANNSTYGLGAAVHSNDTRQALRVTSALDAGTVWCNQYGLLHPGVPFGGFKMSGIGRELGTYGLEAYTQVKAVHQNLSHGA
jgi:aldehyde dehydrogenase (NAD+)